MSQTSAHLHRLANDALIWKSLFLRHFATSKATQKLSARAQDEGSQWKALYRLQTNWKEGQASASYILRHNVLPQPPPLNIPIASQVPITSIIQERRQPSMVQFIGNHVFTASTSPTHTVPRISLHRLGTTADHQKELGSFAPDSLVAWYSERPHLLNRHPISVTELRLDEGQQITSTNRLAQVRLAVFYSSSQYVLLRIHIEEPNERLKVVEEHAHLDMPLLDRPDPILDARFHLPLLVTVSERSVLRIHHIALDPETGDFDVLLTQAALQSQLCWRPLTLNLRRKSKSTFRFDIVYSTPWFPSSFTIALQEFKLLLPAASQDSSGMLSVETQAATAIPPPEPFRPRPLVTGLDLHDQYIVASREDNTIDLFEILRPSSGIRVEHRRRLFSHTCAVQSISFDGRRCVSGAKDGSLKVWHLLQQHHHHHHQHHQQVQKRKKVDRSSFKEVVGVTEPDTEEYKASKSICWEEQWATNAAAGAVGEWPFYLLYLYV